MSDPGQTILRRFIYVDDAATNDVLKVDGSSPKRLVPGRVAHGELTGVSANQHHNEDHRARHISGGGDAFLSTDLLEAIVKRLRESGGATLLMGAVADGEFLKRSGTNVIGASAGGATLESGTLWTITGTKSVSGTTSELTLLSGVLEGSASLGADYLTVGKSIRAELHGEIGRISGSLTFRLKLGSNVIASIVVTPAVMDSQMPLAIDAFLTCRAVGASGDVFGRLKVNYDVNAGAGGSSLAGRMEGWQANGSDLTVDTTGALTYDLTVQPSVSSAMNYVEITTGLGTWHDPSP